MNIVDTVNHPIVTSAKNLFLKHSKDALDKVPAARFNFTRVANDEVARQILEDIPQVHLVSYKTIPKVVALAWGKTIHNKEGRLFEEYVKSKQTA